MMHFSRLSLLRMSSRSLIQWSLVLLLLGVGTVDAKPGGKGGGKTPTPSYVPMSLDQESYFFRVAADNTCLGEDDELEWAANGSLAPGESFSYTPAYPGCNGHPAAISIIASWGNGTLSLSSRAPDADFASWDADQLGQIVKAPVVERRAQLCMFPAYSADGVTYTITLINNSSETVHDIQLHGRNENDWAIFYYPRCMNADADGDGWNDSLEHSMANLVYPIGYIDGIFQPDLLWGSNYLRKTAQTPYANDEIDSYPPDFDDNGLVDGYDIAAVERFLGQGNGITLEEISPNPGALWYHNNTLPWRRYDLDGDGYVGEEDRQIVQRLVNLGAPMVEDVISPTARVTVPVDGGSVPRGENFMIKSHVWDNAALSRVEYLVDGKTICSVADPLPGFGYTSPFYFCWWDVPKRSRSYQIEVRAYDAAGNTGVSRQVMVHAE